MNATITQREIYDELWKDASTHIEKIRNTSDEETADEVEQEYRDYIEKLLNIFWYLPGESEWRHIADLEKPHFDIGDLLGQNEINTIADNYFLDGKLRSVKMDWLFIDVLIAHAYEKIRSQFAKETMPRMYRLGETSMGNKKRWGLISWWTFTFLLKWSLWLILFAASVLLSIEKPMFLLLTGLLLIGFFLRRSKKKKLLKPIVEKYLAELKMVKRVYTLTSTLNINWDVLKSELDETRKAGIEWNSALYTAYNHRKR